MSSNFVSFPPAKPELFLVGFRLDPSVEDAQFYTLVMLQDGEEKPLLVDGRLVFFRRLDAAARALAQAPEEFRNAQTPPADMELLCDLAQALYVINTQESDEEGVLLDCIACLDTLVRATGLSVPLEYGRTLATLSGHLEKSGELTQWLASGELRREQVEDALLWCIGAIACKSRWL